MNNSAADTTNVEVWSGRMISMLQYSSSRPTHHASTPAFVRKMHIGDAVGGGMDYSSLR